MSQKDHNGVAGEEGNIKEIVEACLATEDLTPLLRLILDSDAGTAAHRAAHGSLPDAVGEIAEPKDPFEEHWAMVELIQRCLEAVAADQDRIILDVCHANSLEISQCVSELSDMHLLINDLQRLMSANNSKLQAAGSALLGSAQSLSELYTVQANVGAGIGAVAGMREVLQLCLEVGQLLDKSELYPALLLLERIKSTKLEPLMVGLTGDVPTPAMQQQQQQQQSTPSQALFGGTASAVLTMVPSVKPKAASALSAANNPAVSSLALKAFFQNLLSELTAAAKQLALSEFNSWLVMARMHAQRLGLRAIRRAATERQLEEDLARERRTLLIMLDSGQDVRSVAGKLAASAARQEWHKDGAAGPVPGVLQASSAPGQAQDGTAGSSGLLATAAPAAGDGDAAGQNGAAARAAAKIMERANARARERQRKAAVAHGSDVAPDPTLAESGAPNLAPVATTSSFPSHAANGATMPQPDLSTLHVGRSHLALKEVLTWQRQQAASTAARGGAAVTPLPGAVPSGGTVPTASRAQPVLGVPLMAAEGDVVLGLLHGFDLTGLLRCMHVHKVLGKLHKFQEYYLEQRRLQVTNDLAPPQHFLETYQPYLAQVTGFFVVESSVQRLIPELMTQEQVMFLWEGATSSLRTSLDLALESVRSAPIMVLLKDFVMLMCMALGQCGFSTAVVQDVLLINRPRYHDLLMASAAKEAAQAVESDSLTAGHQVLSEGQLRDIKVLGLPLVLEGMEGAELALPIRAPFSKCIPALLQQVHSFVRDSVQYLQGLFSPWEFPQAIFHHRNRMVTKVVVDVLQARINAAAALASLQACLRMVANVWALLQSLDALDAWTVEQARPQQQQGKEDKHEAAAAATGLQDAKEGAGRSRKAAAAQDSLASNAQVALRATQDVAERAVLRLVAQRVSKALDKLRALPWLPPGPGPPGGSPYLQELIHILQDVFSEARATLPRTSYLYLCRTIMRSIGSAIIRLFSPNGAVKQYNLCAIQRLAGEVSELQTAAAQCGVPDVTLEFAAAAQLCSLLLSDKVEEVLVPEMRKQRYPQLETSTIVIALDRYKELSKIGRDKTNFPTQRAINNIAKQLRGQMVQGATTRAIGDF